MPDSVQAGITWGRFVLALRYGFLCGVGVLVLQILMELIIDKHYDVSSSSLAIAAGLNCTAISLFRSLALPVESPVVRRVLHALTLGTVEFVIILFSDVVRKSLSGESLLFPDLGFPLLLALGFAVFCFMVEPTLVERPKNAITSGDPNPHT